MVVLVVVVVLSIQVEVLLEMATHLLFLQAKETMAELVALNQGIMLLAVVVVLLLLERLPQPMVATEVLVLHRLFLVLP